MSSKKSDKSKKVPAKEAKAQEAPEPEPVPEVILDKPKDIRTIVIEVQCLKNVVPLYPVSDVKVILKYLDQEIGQTHLVPVVDGDLLMMNERFEIHVDVESAKQLDLLASNPIFLSAIQTSGSLDNALYEQLRKSVDVEKPLEEVESLFSLYEAFTGERPSVQLTDTLKKKKAKKEKPTKSATSRNKSKSRSKSVVSKGSKSSKKSKNSKASTRSESTSRSESVVIKSEIYGMCALDLIPLFYGETSFAETLIVRPVKKSCQILSTHKNQPQLSVAVSLTGNVKLANVTNILNVTVESICNVPQLMLSEMDCRVCAMLPLQHKFPSPTVFFNPKITTGAPNSEVPKRWPGIHDIAYNANTTNYLIDSDFDQIVNKANLDVRDAFKDESARLEFNYLKRNVLFKTSNNDFACHIFSHRKLVLEIYLTPRGKKRHDDIIDEQEEAHQRSKSMKTPPYLHLMAILDVVSLLYPGITRMRIAAPVTTFTYGEAAKWGLDDSFFMPKPRSDVGCGRMSKTKLDTSRKKKGADRKEKVTKKDKQSTGKEDKNLAGQLPPKPDEPPQPEPSVQVYNEDGKPCFILVEIELLKPIKPKRDIAELQLDLRRMQMDALQSSKTIINKQVADEYYQQTIKEIMDDLSKHWVKYNDIMNIIPQPNYNDFVEYLQRAGAYQAYLNSLITSATLLITNKYKCEETDFKNSKTYQNLLSEVYIDLISQMHGTINNLKPLGAKYSTPWQLSFFYAKEAAELQLSSTADRYFLERIINDDTNNPDFWFDYAIFNLEMKNNDKAFECVRESIAIDRERRYSLLLFGALLAEKNNMPDAEIALLNVMILEAKWLEGWIVLYLFYQKWDRADGMEMALEMASKLPDDDFKTDYFLEYEELAWTHRKIPRTMFFKTAILLLKMRLYSWVELVLAEEVFVSKYYGYVNYLLAVASYYQKDYAHAMEHVEEAKESLGADHALLSLSGHILLGENRYGQARDEYLKVIESFDRPEDIHMVYVNCAECLRKLGDDQKARKLLLVACKLHRTPHVWLRLGIIYYEENDLLSAEECFGEANMIDNRHAEVWAYLTLVNLKLKRGHEAEQCYQQAVRSKLCDDELYKAISEEFNKVYSS